MSLCVSHVGFYQNVDILIDHRHSSCFYLVAMGRFEPFGVEETQTASNAALGRCYARVTRERKGSFVEFELSIEDRDLSLALIMPPAAFAEFCERHGVIVVQPDPADARPDQPVGLYRPPGESIEDV